MGHRRAPRCEPLRSCKGSDGAGYRGHQGPKPFCERSRATRTIAESPYAWRPTRIVWWVSRLCAILRAGTDYRQREVFVVAISQAATMTGGRAVVESLRAEGVEVVFGIPGRHTISVYDALLDTPEIRSIVTRHEQGAAFAADGYARATGKVGVCLVTAGPGAANTMAAMTTAYADSVPILNITSEIATAVLGKQKGVVHDSKDQSGMFATVTDWGRRVTSVAEIPQAIHEAMRVLKTARPRPAVIEIPLDVLECQSETTTMPVAEEYDRPGPSPQEVKEMAAKLA